MTFHVPNTTPPELHLPAALADAQRIARNAVRGKRRLLELIARAGYAARGLVYCLVGAVALRAAFGHRIEEHSSDATRDVLLMLWRGPYGGILLCTMGLGLAAYALWCFIRAIADPEWEGENRRALMRRIGFFSAGLIYTALVFWVCRILAAAIGLAHHPGHEPGPKHWTARLMSAPLGRLLVVSVGVGFLVYAVMQIRLVWMPHWLACDRRNLRPWAERLVRALGRFGYITRAFVFAGIGIFLLAAARNADARRAEGLNGTLLALRREPAGAWLLAIVAIGLMAYGLYDLVLARYRILRLSGIRPMGDCTPSQ